MVEPSRRTSRLTIAGAALAVIGVAAAGFALGRSTAEPAFSPPVPVPMPTPTAPAPAPTPVLPTVQTPLGRAELIAAAASAADAFAAGQPLPAGVAALAGREFDLRLPFGCPGVPQAERTPLGWEYDAEDEALRVRAEPVRWSPGEWLPPAPVPSDAKPAIEAIEGFWIARPWTSSDACPVPASAPTPAVPAAPMEQTLGIAQFFTPDSSRVGRRDGRAYQAVKSVAPDALNTSRGLHLRLRGKLAQAPGAGPVLCSVRGSGRPVCLLTASFDQIAIENPAIGTTVATWDVSSQDRGLTPR